MRYTVSYAARPPTSLSWGVLELDGVPLVAGVTADGAICRLSFKSRSVRSIVEDWQQRWPACRMVADRAAVRDWHKGSGTCALLLTGTVFQQAVWRALLKIPAGRTLTYGDIAARIGQKQAARAVGSACGANPVCLLVPCHRVIASGGGLGGFADSLALKQKLLQAEGVTGLINRRLANPSVGRHAMRHAA